jgi:[phosphatase 2A protein]-leucine-carboxy methyltransferase
MASIPNLNTLRTGRRGPRLRGRRGGPSSTAHDEEQLALNEQDLEASRNAIVQQTDHDASSSRMSAISTGYLTDPYAEAFYPSGQPIAKRYPIINRGTYVRTTAIDDLVLRFLKTYPSQPKQIISLGAGSDTRFFRLCAGTNYPVTYHELDFPENVNPKRTALRSSPSLSRLILPVENGPSYHLHALDLRSLTLTSPPIISSLSPTTATLLLSECCLCYLPPETTSSILSYFTMNITSPTALGIILYEPIRPDDAFGRTMVANLASRGIHMQTLREFGTLGKQRERLRNAGFGGGQGARDVLGIFEGGSGGKAWIDGEERRRVEGLEWLDEVEEWRLLAGHYCVAWGWRGEEEEGKGVFGEAWGDVEGGETEGERREMMGR